MKTLKEKYKCTIIITIPNKDFNQFYSLSEEQTRHEDHKWEFGYSEIHKYFDIFKPTYFELGDSVNNITPTIGMIL